MKKRTLLTKEAVKNAIDTLEQQSIYPSLEKIRQITGGSTQRISKLRKEIEIENEEKSQTDNKEHNKTDNKEHDVIFRIEARMAQMELLFSQRFADIDARLATKERDGKEVTIQKLQAKTKTLEIKNALLIKQLNKEFKRVKELNQTLKQAKELIVELEASQTNIPLLQPATEEKLEESPKGLPKRESIAIKEETVLEDHHDSDHQEMVINPFNALINAQWGEEQKAEIALQKAAREYLMKKWVTDSHLLDSAVLDSNVTEKGYIAVSVSKQHESKEKPYILHCLIFDRDTKQLSSYRKEYVRSKTAHDKAHQYLNQIKL